MFETVDRHHTHAIKWEKFKAQHMLPMWVADMDLASPQAITDALVERMQHPVYGYTHPWVSLNDAVVNWCQRQYQWAIQPEWIVWMPGVVPSFNLACRAFGNNGRVVVQSPNYPPMLHAAELHGGQTIALPVTYNGKQYQWDWAQLERELSHPDCHLMLLCNPMNPHGTVLSKSELTRLTELCQQYAVVLCSDEIHCDLILDGTPHTPIGSLDDRSITLMAASKTFNVAGFGCSFAIIPDADLRKQWNDRKSGIVADPNFAGMIAAEVAFTQCDDWHQALLKHLAANQQRVSEVISALPGMAYRPQSATFLAWIESTDPQLDINTHFIKAGVMPSEGSAFGAPQHTRLNFGTGTDRLEQALRLITDAWK